MELPPRDPGFFTGIYADLKIYLGLFLTWAAGTSGQIVIAGGFGGAMRWAMTIRNSMGKPYWRVMLDGFASVITGVIFANYFGPYAGFLLDKWVGGAQIDNPHATAAFAAGLGGMSCAKIILAVIDAQYRNLTKG